VDRRDSEPEDQAHRDGEPTYQGKRTTGQAFVEQFGIWK
jgi:hypothetical protein